MRQDVKADPKASKRDIVVIVVHHEAACAECGGELCQGDFLRVEDGKLLCLECAGLGRLEFLGRGDAAVTRRASKYSSLRAVVVKWSTARKRYERQGILVEPEAIERAEQESLADADLRARRQEREAHKRAQHDAQFIKDFAAAIRRVFPSCPADQEIRIAEHACQKHSGRVGRTAAAKEFSPETIRLAVVAHIRHVHTNYERLLSCYGDRRRARDEVEFEVRHIMHRWEKQ